MFANGTRSARDQYPTNTSSSTIYKIMGISIRSSSRGNIFTKAAKLDHLLKLKVGWQKLKVDLESCWQSCFNRIRIGVGRFGFGLVTILFIFNLSCQKNNKYW